jgi:hypothetical protein
MTARDTAVRVTLTLSQRPLSLTANHPSRALNSTVPSGIPPNPFHPPSAKQVRMATPACEYSLDCQLLERMKFSGIKHRNLADLVSIVVSLKNKYGIGPHAAAADGYLIRNALTLSCLNGIHHAKQSHQHPARHSATTRLNHLAPAATKTAQFNVDTTLGG